MYIHSFCFVCSLLVKSLKKLYLGTGGVNHTCINNFVALGVTEPSTMGRVKGGSLDERIHSYCIFIFGFYLIEYMSGLVVNNSHVE